MRSGDFPGPGGVGELIVACPWCVGTLTTDVPVAHTGDLADIFGDDVVKVLAVHRDLEPEDFWRRVEASAGEQVVTTWSSSFALVEISAAGVTKATTLATLAAESLSSLTLS